MEMKIIEEKENVLLNRKELKITVKHEGQPTPSKQEVYAELAKRYSVPEENIKIDYIFTKKGVGESLVKAKIYPHKVREVEKKEEKPEEKTEGKTKEEKPEEKKAEEEGKAEEKEAKETKEEVKDETQAG